MTPTHSGWRHSLQEWLWEWARRSPDPRARSLNQFYRPMAVATGAPHDPAKELEYQIQIGSKLFQEYPVQSLSEAFAGLSTRSGDLTTVKLKGAAGNTIPANEMPSAMHIVLEGDQILEIRDTGVQVFNWAPSVSPQR